MPAHLLLVDDELHILKAAEFKFKRQGYQVRCADDGQDAWEKIQADPPDILVTDLQMPRMTGLQLIKRLRDDQRFAELPAILLTAKGFELDREDIISRLGVFEIVSKPFSPRDLCKRVEMALAPRDHHHPQADRATGEANADETHAVQDSAAVRSAAPGSAAPGSVAPGGVASGSIAPGSIAPGGVAPGSAVPAVAIDPAEAGAL